MNEKTSIAYTKVPSSLSLNVLERFVDKKTLEKLKKDYVEERNKGFLRKGRSGNFCPHCGEKLPIVKS